MQSLMVNQLPTDGFVSCAVAEQHPVRHNGGTAASHGKHSGEEGDEEELGLLGVADGKQRFADGLFVYTARKRRIGKAEGVSLGVGVVGRKAVFVLNIGIVHAMQHQVHGPDAKHGLVGVEAMEHAVLVVVGVLFLQELLLVVLGDILGTLHNKTGTAHRRVADGVLQRGLHQFHHHPDNVAGRAELSVVACRGHLAEDVLVHVAHRVAVVHVELVHAFHYLDQCAWIGNKEGGTLHKAAVCTFLTLVEALYEYESILADGLIHLLGLEVHKVVPTQIVVWHIAVAVGVVPRTGFEYGVVDGAAQQVGSGLSLHLRVVQHLHKEEVCHLFEDGDRVGDASCPKGVPDTVYSVLYIACNHCSYLISLVPSENVRNGILLY